VNTDFVTANILRSSYDGISITSIISRMTVMRLSTFRSTINLQFANRSKDLVSSAVFISKSPVILGGRQRPDVRDWTVCNNQSARCDARSDKSQMCSTDWSYGNVSAFWCLLHNCLIRRCF